MMLNLLKPTPPAWAEQAADDLDGLLSDHAHCELKAAHSALSLVARYGGEAPELIEPMTALAREETQHFAMVAERITERNAALCMPTTDGYVRKLRRAARADHREHPALLDRLLVSALIEARSCERFSVLANHLPPACGGLRDFYRGLMASEARHYRLFAGLAEARFGRASRTRFKELAKREAEVVSELPLGPTVHG